MGWRRRWAWPNSPPPTSTFPPKGSLPCGRGVSQHGRVGWVETGSMRVAALPPAKRCNGGRAASLVHRVLQYIDVLAYTITHSQPHGAFCARARRAAMGSSRPARAACPVTGDGVEEAMGLAQLPSVCLSSHRRWHAHYSNSPRPYPLSPHVPGQRPYHVFGWVIGGAGVGQPRRSKARIASSL